jgi:hypothetical protein
VFSFGKACDKCHVKSVIRVHDPLFYWKVIFSSLVLPTLFHTTLQLLHPTFSFELHVFIMALRLQQKGALAWQKPILMDVTLLLTREKAF